jgi:hypothetical protein
MGTVDGGEIKAAFVMQRNDSRFKKGFEKAIKKFRKVFQVPRVHRDWNLVRSAKKMKL